MLQLMGGRCAPRWGGRIVRSFGSKGECEMNVVKWVREKDGTWAWIRNRLERVTVSTVSGKWRITWWDARQNEVLHDERYDCADHARVMAERLFPPKAYAEEWFESLRGGYLSCFGGKAVYVRQSNIGWYAFRQDGFRQCRLVQYSRGSLRSRATGVVRSEGPGPVCRGCRLVLGQVRKKEYEQQA